MKFNRIILVSILLLIFAIGAVSAADENITDAASDVLSAEPADELESAQGDFTELNSLVKNTASGETLYLQKDYVNDGSFRGTIRISKAITIDGQGHTIDGKNTGSIFYMSNSNSQKVTLKNINFVNTKSNAVTGENSEYSTITNCSFVNCYASGGISSGAYGGAISGGNAYNCSFVNCYASGGSSGGSSGGAYGGAISGGNAYNCSFVNCYASGGRAYGGAVSPSGMGEGVIDNCTFIDCYATTVGGAIYCDSWGNVKNSYFRNCTTKDSKAAILRCTATNCTFVKCEAFAIIHGVQTNDITYGNTAYVYVYGESKGVVNVTVNGETKMVTPYHSGMGASVSFTGLPVGTHQVKVTYPGSAKYKAQTVTTTLKVTMQNPIKSVAQPAANVGYGENTTIRVNMQNDKINGNVWYTISDENKTKLITDKMHIVKGVATTSIPDLSMGKYYLHIYFAGNAHYNAQTIKKTFNVVRGTPIASVNVSNWAPGEDVTIKVKVNNVNGNIWYTVSDSNKTKIITNSCHIEDGWAIISVPSIKEGKYYLHIYYAGNVHYAAQTIKTSFEVTKISPELSVAKTTVNGKTVLTANLAEDAPGNIKFEVNGNTYKSQIVNGVATVTLPDMAPGTYTLKTTYAGNYKYLAETKTRSITIK